MTENHDDETRELAMLFNCSARVLLKSDAPAGYLDWIANAGPQLARGIAERVDPRTGPVGNFFRMLGVAIYGAMPLPSNEYRPRKLPLPGRNEPCLCGSGRKYKHCCLSLGGLLDLQAYNLLGHVLDCLPKTAYADLPGSAVDRLAVWDVAQRWREDGQVDRAVALLEPWFKGDAPLAAPLEPLFDELMDCYLDLDAPRKRNRLVETVLARGDRALRAVALQRRAAMEADKHDFEAAWRTFAEAQRTDPDSPAHATLELTLLAAQGDVEQARERARFWLARLERRRDPGLDGIIEFVRSVREDPLGAIGALEGDRFPGLQRLSTLLATLPPLEVHYTVTDEGEGERTLVPDAALEAFEAEWRAGFEQEKPMLTAAGTWQDDAPDFETGLELLAGEPIGWQSFEVLDDLLLALNSLPLIDEGAATVEPLLARAAALLDAVLNRPGTPPGLLSWGWQENRPALRCLVQTAVRALHDPARGVASEDFVTAAERILALNPGDNHYLREPLARAYLEIGRIADAVALADRYEDDLAGATLNRILAHYCAGDEARAHALLCAAAVEHETAIKMLLAAKPREPKPDSEYGITMGGKYEAWLYRDAARALWERHGALAWLARTYKTIAR